MDCNKNILLFLFLFSVILSLTTHVVCLPRFFNHVSSSNAPTQAPLLSISGVPSAAPVKSPARSPSEETLLETTTVKPQSLKPTTVVSSESQPPTSTLVLSESQPETPTLVSSVSQAESKSFGSSVSEPQSSSSLSSLSQSLASSAGASVGLETVMSTASKTLSQVDVPSVDPALLKICGVTEDPALCANSILPHLKGLVEPANVLKTEIEACVEEAKKAMAIIEKMGSEQSLSAPMSSAIDSCKETYTDLFDSLKSAKEAIFAHDIGTLTVMLSAVISDITTCDDGFVEMELPSPLENLEVRTKVEKLAGNCLDMAKLVN